MAKTDLAAQLDEEIRQAVGYASSELSEQRETAQEYYYGQPFGNEMEGRSAYVSRDVADTIEWIMPSLMRIFMGGDTIVRFEPQGPEDEKNAQQATDFINHVFQKQNDGFLTLYTFCKDALLFKNGFVKVYPEKYSSQRTVSYDALTEDEFAYLLKDVPEEDILEHTPYPGPMGMSHAVKFRKKQEKTKCCVVGVPPEEILVNKNPVAPLSRNRIVVHRRRVTISELKEMGFEDVDDLPTGDDDLNPEKIARFSYDQTDSQDSAKDPANRMVWLAEAYWKVDHDEDGIAELRRVIMAGNKILENEEIDSIPIVTMCPIILPHKLFGMSVADMVMDIQELKSSIFRIILDNMHFANQGRYMALDGMVNIDDLLTVRPGGIVRVKTFDAVKPLQPPVLGQPAFNLLEYIDTIKENRTGVTRYNQGLDADSLNKTATGISQIMNAAQARVELIARVFAETGIKDLFYAILECVQKHYDRTEVVRLRNEWVQMDPQEWTNKFDLSVMVGLGTGSKEQQMAALADESQFQLVALQAGLPIITPENVYNLRMKALEAKNVKGGDLFYTHPAKMPPQPPRQDPAIVKAQMDAQADQIKIQAKTQSDQQKLQVKAATDQQKFQLDAAKESQTLALEHKRLQMEMQMEVAKMKLEMEKMRMEMELKRQEAAADIQMQRESHQQDMQLRREETSADIAMRREENAADVAVKREKNEQDAKIKKQQAKKKKPE